MKISYRNRFQAMAFGLGIFVALISMAMVFVYQFVNIRTISKVQNAFIEQYSGLVVSKLSDFESKLSGLQALLLVLNEDNKKVNGFHINITSSHVWADLHSLLYSSESLFAANDFSLTDQDLRVDQLTSVAPSLSVINQSVAVQPEQNFKLRLSVPLLQQEDPQPQMLGMLNMELDVTQLQKILELLEDTTKFAASLQFTNSSGDTFSIRSKLFDKNHDAFFSPVFPQITRNLVALGGTWTLELKPTQTTLVVAGLSTRAMVLKLLACLALGFLAWLMLSYSFHLFFTRQRQQLMDELERVNAELTEQALQLEASRKNAEDFIGILGHEIRNPLATMKCVSTELEHMSFNPDAQKLLQIQGSALSTALDTLNNILDLKKMELSALQLEDIEFDLRYVVKEVKDFVSVQCRSKRVTLKTEIDPDIPLKVMGDPLRLKQVLMNLMNNAVKFTRAGSVVDLTVLVQEVSPGQVKVSFAVSDCGDGIAPNMIRKLLEPYKQADSSIARQFGGTGLGLNIASRIIMLMGGELKIESTVGVGTCCQFELAFKHNNDKKTNSLKYVEFNAGPHIPQISRKISRDGLQLRLLYVDDNQFNLMVAEELLKKTNHHLQTFSSPGEAIFFLENCSERIDIVLSDLHMPEMGGAEFAALVRQGRHSSTAFLAALTASSVEEVQLLHAENFDSILMKPFNLESILTSFDQFRSKADLLLT